MVSLYLPSNATKNHPNRTFLGGISQLFYHLKIENRLWSEPKIDFKFSSGKTKYTGHFTNILGIVPNILMMWPVWPNLNLWQIIKRGCFGTIEKNLKFLNILKFFSNEDKMLFDTRSKYKCTFLIKMHLFLLFSKCNLEEKYSRKYSLSKIYSEHTSNKFPSFFWKTAQFSNELGNFFIFLWVGKREDALFESW